MVRINVPIVEKYKLIHSHHAIPSGRDVTGPKFIPQKGIDHKHKAKEIFVGMHQYISSTLLLAGMQVVDWHPHIGT